MSNQISKPKGSKPSFFSKIKFNKIFVGLFIVFAAAAIVAGIGFLVQNNSGKTALAATCTWTGNNNGDFSDSGNWSGCSGGVPQNGDDITFPASASEYNLNNDISGLNLSGITVEMLTNNSYSLDGNSITVNGPVIFSGGSNNNRFTFYVDINTAGVSGTGEFALENGRTLVVNGGSYNFSGTISGNGTFLKSGSGTQTLTNTNVGSSVYVNVTGYYLQLAGNTTINNQFYNNGGGILFNGTNDFNNNASSNNGSSINLFPGSIVNANSGYSLTGGNVGIDVSNGVAGKLRVGNNTTNLSNGTLGMRFFGTYSVGQTFTILESYNYGSLSGNFSNAPENGEITAEGWGINSVISDVRVRLNYGSGNVVATVVSIVNKFCEGNKTYTANSGTVTNGVINYLPNSNCKFTIAPNNADSVTLNFNSFNTEDINDEVKIYDGLTTSSPLLGTFSGSTLPSSVTANSGLMTIIFTSNATIENSGFNATWSSTLLPSPTIGSITTVSGSGAGGTAVTVNGSNFVTGQYQNIKSLGGSGLDGARGMVVDSSGQYVSGEFSDSVTLGNTTLTSSGGTDIYVAKIDSSGNYVWAVKAGGVAADGFTRKQSMANNNTDNTLLIAGYFTGTSANFGGTTLSGSSGSNVFIAKINKTDGSFIWAKRAGGNTTEIFDGSQFPIQYGSSLDVDSSGNIYFSGSVKGSSITFGSIIVPTNNTSNQEEPFVAKLDSSGNFIWVKTFSDSDSGGKANGLKVDSSGNIYAQISFYNSLTIGSTTLTTNAANGGQNIALVKLDNSGNNIWAVSYGLNGANTGVADLPYGVGLDSSQNVYITGYFSGAVGKFGSINLVGSSSGQTVFTAKVSPAGTFSWANALPSPDFATARDMYVDSSNKIWIAGAYTDVLTDGTKTITGSGVNAFFAQYDTTGNLVELNGIGGTGGRLAANGVGGNQVRAIYEYNGKVYIAGEYFDTIGIGGQTITSVGNQDGFYTTWVSDTISVRIGGVEVNGTYISPTQLSFITPPNTKGFKDVIVTNSNGSSFTLSGGYEYIAPEIQNSNISSMICSPSTSNINITVSCVITTNINTNIFDGSVNVRIGSGGPITNCPINGIGTTITCNVNVGNTPGTLASQYNGSGSGSTYANGNNITVIAPTLSINPISGPTGGGTLVTANITNGTFSDGPNVIQTSAGAYHTCALLSTGNVKCWGNGGYGQLGYGNTNSIGDNELPATTNAVDIGGTVTQITTGQYHTCALLSTGNVRCWGYNGYGQLGYGNTNSVGGYTTPASAGDVNVGGTVTQITAGANHTCALLSTGNVRCWGNGNSGQLGYGNTNRIGDNESPASAGDVNVGGTVTAISAGQNHTCALLTSGNVRCWGNGNSGQLGYGNTNSIGDNETPASAGDVNVGGAVTAIYTGDAHTCALLRTGNVRC